MIVYQRAMDAAVLVDGAARLLPRPHRHLADQMRRSAGSVVLNVAEGAGEFSPAEKRRFYRMALRSATECQATVELSKRLGALSDKTAAACEDALLHCVRLLVKMASERRPDM
ncbi:MAG: four helix bundle protein [Planctomycetota bacterium]|jgi:four helix bundle protein